MLQRSVPADILEANSFHLQKLHTEARLKRKYSGYERAVKEAQKYYPIEQDYVYDNTEILQKNVQELLLEAVTMAD